MAFFALSWTTSVQICGATSDSTNRFHRPQHLAAIDTAIHDAIQQRQTPGCVIWIERDQTIYRKAYGLRALEPKPEPISEDTIYDAASLTKVLATAPAIALLIERGKLDLDSPVNTYLPEFTGEGRETITLRHLATHTSGLRPGISREPPWSGYNQGIERALAEKPTDPPGTVFRYSDINFILLGEVVHRVSHMPLNEFCRKYVYHPLLMRDTGFKPSSRKRGRIAPTEPGDQGMLRGIVHDPTSRLMGGVSGHAGLFTTAADIARFARMMLNRGVLNDVRVFKPETVALMTRIQSPDQVKAKRGLGWDIDSDYSRPRGELFPLGSYGHTGWTGTCLWIDPSSNAFWIFLSNRNHPDGKGNVLALQRVLGTLAAQVVLKGEIQEQ
jgi:CubicO group peptidase (beta-lactamase class C family)